MRGIVNKQITLVRACQEYNFLMFSFNPKLNASNIYEAYSFSQLENLQSDDIDIMYIGGNDASQPQISQCWNRIMDDDDEININGYVEIDIDEYTWEWAASGWYLICSIIMALFFVLIEWLFYSYNEIMIPRKDWRAYVMWYLIRMGWMSFMFTIIIAHSLLVNDEIVYIVGDFQYIWVKADCFIATGFIGLFLLICLCCCCFQES